MLWAMLIMTLACWAYAFAVVFLRARAIVLEREGHTAWALALWERYLRNVLHHLDGMRVLVTDYGALLADPARWSARTRRSRSQRPSPTRRASRPRPRCLRAVPRSRSSSWRACATST